MDTDKVTKLELKKRQSEKVYDIINKIIEQFKDDRGDPTYRRGYNLLTDLQLTIEDDVDELIYKYKRKIKQEHCDHMCDRVKLDRYNHKNAFIRKKCFNDERDECLGHCQKCYKILPDQIMIKSSNKT